ncbi:armadillo-type protein [Cladochytrium replicatum]|nr:armadillo-type protein [Cladochytrium replicatum]
MGSYDLSEELNWLLEDSASQTIDGETDIPHLLEHDLDAVQDILDELSAGCRKTGGRAVLDAEMYKGLKSFIKHVDALPGDLSTSLFRVLLDGVGHLLSDMEDEDDSDDSTKHAVQAYVFLLHWLVEGGDRKWKRIQKGAKNQLPLKKGKGSRKVIARDSDWPALMQATAEMYAKILSIDLFRSAMTQKETDDIVSMILKSVSCILDDPESVKKQDIRRAIFASMSFCADKLKNGDAIKIRVLQNLESEHLAEPMAEFLQTIFHINEDATLLSAVLQEFGKIQFMDDPKKTKAAALFIVKLSHLLPKEVLKHMVYLQGQIDSPVTYQVRQAMIDVIGNLIHSCVATDESGSAAEKMHSFYEILQERFHEMNQWVRVKLLQVLIKLTQRRDVGVTDIPINVRRQLIELTIERLHDKNSFVRKAAVKLLSEFIETSPFTMLPLDQGILSLQLFKARFVQWENELKARFPTVALVDAKIEDVAAPAEERESPDENEDQRDEDQRDEDDENEEKEEMEDESRAEMELEKSGESQIEDAKVDEKEQKGSQAEIGTYDVANTTMFEDNGRTAEEIDQERAKMLIIKNMLEYYGDGIFFIENQIGKAISVLCDLLRSSVKAEVNEVMSFFVVACRYGIESGSDGLRRMVHKIWDTSTSNSPNFGKEAEDHAGSAKVGGRILSVRQHLVDCYAKVYLKSQKYDEGTPEWAEEVVARLINLVQTLTLSEGTSLEQVFATMMEANYVDGTVIDLLWKVFSANRKKVSPPKRRSALILLRMFAKADLQVVSNNLEVLIRLGLGVYGRDDLLLGREVCVTLQRLVPASGAKVIKIPFPRLPPDHAMCQKLKDAIIQSSKSPLWFGMAEQALNTIYLLCDQPDRVCGAMLQRLAGEIFSVRSAPQNDLDAMVDKLSDMELASQKTIDDEDDVGEDSDNLSPRGSVRTADKAGKAVEAVQLAKLCFLIGHVAIKQIVHLEAIDSDWKRKKAKCRDAPTAGRATASRPNGAPAAADDLETVIGTAEDEFAEAVAYVRERELLFGEKSILAIFAPLISWICANNMSFGHPMLEIHPPLALAKLMCVSAEFCENNLQLLFPILSKADNPIVRCNSIISLGDMTICFNALIDQNISYMYARLMDRNPRVRIMTLMVLTHLILNGMVKVKGQISEIAKCLEDPGGAGTASMFGIKIDNYGAEKAGEKSRREGTVNDDGEGGEATQLDVEDTGKRIRDLAKHFFSELALKDDTAIYNNLPDIISNLGHVQIGVKEEVFRNIIKFLFSFIKKDKQVENVVEKLCIRFKSAQTERQWRDIAYCLSLLSYTSEKSVKKVIEGLPHYKDKLGEQVVYKCFKDIAAKVDKLPNLECLHEECTENSAAAAAAGQLNKVFGTKRKRIAKGLIFGKRSQEAEDDQLEVKDEGVEDEPEGPGDVEMEEGGEMEPEQLVVQPKTRKRRAAAQADNAEGAPTLKSRGKRRTTARANPDPEDEENEAPPVRKTTRSKAVRDPEDGENESPPIRKSTRAARSTGTKGPSTRNAKKGTGKARKEVGSRERVGMGSDAEDAGSD